MFIPGSKNASDERASLPRPGYAGVRVQPGKVHVGNENHAGGASYHDPLISRTRQKLFHEAGVMSNRAFGTRFA